MAKKKDTTLPLSQEENEQVQSILQRSGQLAENLRKSTDRQQAEAALNEINTLPEAVQMALLAGLTKAASVDAADILLAIHQFGAIKDVRKEARRALIRLEGTRVYPRWQPPTEQPLPVIEFTAEPARFWKGLVTDTLETGEVQLLLTWEQGAEYRQARMMGFLLDFWGGGVKDFFTEVGSKRHIEEHISYMRTITKDLDVVDCTLAEARRLIEDALAVNKKRGTQPHKDYRLNEKMVRQMVLEAPEAAEDSGSSFIASGMEPTAVVTNFVEALFDGRSGFAYDLLSSDSTVRAGLSRSDWIARRDEWEQAAQPDNFLPGFATERQQQSSGLWLPNLLGGNRSTTRKEVEASWSLELTDTPLSEGLKELPAPTAVYPETKRHWYWATYVLVQDQGEWRIQDIIDEGARARLLSANDLQKRIDDLGKETEEIATQHEPDGPNADEYLQTIVQNIIRALHYDDILIAKLPLDRRLYQEASARAVLLNNYERSLVFLDPLAHRFAEGRAEALRHLAGAEIQLAEEFLKEDEDERAEHFEELAEAALRESLALEDHYLTHLLLTELLIQKNVSDDENEDKLLDEAVAHLHQAQALTTNTETLASIEHQLADIAEMREQDNEAIQHYRRMTELQPDNLDAWLHLGNAYDDQDNFEEAEAAYKHALEIAPDSIQPYSALARLYIQNEEDTKAVELVEEGLQKHPDSAHMRGLAAMILAISGNYPRARALLDEAERMDPEMEMLPEYRAVVEAAKPQPAKSGLHGQRPGKNKGKKHRKR
jgi:Flp pilus assembly protein TadD